jgi:outer membrane cobalamin receptor
MSKIKIILTLLMFQLCAEILLADVPDTIQLASIEIRANAIDSEIQNGRKSFDTLSLQSLASGSLTELLRHHSSVFIKSNGPGGLSTASFRGTAANHTLVLWNGFPVNGLQLGQVDFSTIPIYFIDQINLAWGHAANKRPGGLGGVVELNNKPSFGNNIDVDILQTIGSYNSFGTFAGLSIRKKNVHLKTRVFRKSSANDFEYLNTASFPKQTMKQKNADHIDKGFLQEVHINFKKSLLSFASWNQWNDRSLPPIMTNLERGGDPKEFQNDRFHRNFLSYQYFWDGGKVAFKTSYFKEFQHYYLRTTNALPPYLTVSLIDSYNESSSLMNSFDVEQQLFKHTKLYLQFLFDDERVTSNNFLNDENRSKTSVSVGAETALSKSFTSELSLRSDWVEKNASGLNPSLSISYIPETMRSLRFSMGFVRNLRYPSMNDLFWFPGGNSDLNPEHSSSADFSIGFSPKIQNANLNVRVSGYISEVTDWIQWRPTAYRYWVPENIARVVARGIEWQQQLNFNYSGLDFHLSSNYAFTITTDESPVGKIENSSGKQLIYIPKHNGNVFLNTRYKLLNFTYNIGYTGVRSTSLNSNDNYFGYLPSYWMHNASIGYQLNYWNISLKANNLLDKSYQAVMWRPMPGRHFEIALHYRFEKH